MVKNPFSSAETSIRAAGLSRVSFRSTTWIEAPIGRRLRRSSTWPASRPPDGLMVVSEAWPIPGSGLDEAPELGVAIGVAVAPACLGPAGGHDGGGGLPGAFRFPAGGKRRGFSAPLSLDASWQPAASSRAESRQCQVLHRTQQCLGA